MSQPDIDPIATRITDAPLAEFTPIIKSARHLAPTSQELGPSLECLIGSKCIAIPTDSVGRVIKYSLTTPLPLGREFVGGAGLEGEIPLLSIDLSGRRGVEAPQTRIAEGVLLRVSDAPGIGWVVEVSSVSRFISLQRAKPAAHLLAFDLPEWMVPARDPEGRPILWIEVPAMIRALTTESRAGAMGGTEF